MTTTETTITPDLAPTDIGALLRGYELSLRARNRSPRTIMSYVQTVEIFRAFLVKVGMPTVVDRLTREHVEAFVADQLERWKPKTAHVRYGDLRQFFNLCVEEGEIPSHPMVCPIMGHSVARQNHTPEKAAPNAAPPERPAAQVGTVQETPGYPARGCLAA